MVTELELQIPGLRLAARAHGPEGAPAVVCLHGWLDNAASFDQLAPLLTGMRVLALDLPGHGWSEHRAPGASYLFIDAVADVFAAIDALGLSSVALVGHSLGAALAACVAGAWPDRVARLVLIEGIGPLTDPPADAPRRLAQSVAEQRSKSGRVAPVYPNVEDVVTRLGSAAMPLSPAAARVLCSRGLREVPGGVTWRADARLRVASRLRLAEEQVVAFLAAIRAPTLLLRASQGFPPNSPQMRARVGAIADVREVILPGTHHVHLEDPGPVAARIEEFLGPWIAGGA